MRGCEQAPGWSIFHHGIDVACRYKDLHEWFQDHKTRRPMHAWDLPTATIEHLDDLWTYARDPHRTRAYHVYHDCGKPFTLMIDEQGRRRFPNHAEVSARIFRQIFPDDEENAPLVEQDMLCHTLKGEAADKFARSPDAPTLIFTAWAELHSNAERVFGGLESVSFKIKQKKLTRMTNLIWRALTAGRAPQNLHLSTFLENGRCGWTGYDSFERHQ